MTNTYILTFTSINKEGKESNKMYQVSAENMDAAKENVTLNIEEYKKMMKHTVKNISLDK